MATKWERLQPIYYLRPPEWQEGATKIDRQTIKLILKAPQFQAAIAKAGATGKIAPDEFNHLLKEANDRLAQVGLAGERLQGLLSEREKATPRSTSFVRPEEFSVLEYANKTRAAGWEQAQARFQEQWDRINDWVHQHLPDTLVHRVLTQAHLSEAWFESVKRYLLTGDMFLTRPRLDVHLEEPERGVLYLYLVIFGSTRKAHVEDKWSWRIVKGYQRLLPGFEAKKMGRPVRQEDISVVGKGRAQCLRVRIYPKTRLQDVRRGWPLIRKQQVHLPSFEHEREREMPGLDRDSEIYRLATEAQLSSFAIWKRYPDVSRDVILKAPQRVRERMARHK